MFDNDFAMMMLGKPYRDRCCSTEAVDCWGLVVLYYRLVHGVNIHHSDEYCSGGNFRTCFESEVVYWKKHQEPVLGGIFVSYHGNNPSHVGIVLERDKILHAREKTAVRFDRITTLKRLSTRVEFLTYASNTYSNNAGNAEMDRGS